LKTTDINISEDCYSKKFSRGVITGTIVFLHDVWAAIALLTNMMYYCQPTIALISKNQIMRIVHFWCKTKHTHFYPSCAGHLGERNLPGLWYPCYGIFEP